MNTKPVKILVVRLSALGDVAMTVPVITSLKDQYPNVDITVLSKPWVRPIFDKIGVNFIGADIRKGKAGIIDFTKLFLDLRKAEKWHSVIDLHDVIFSKILRKLFRLTGTPVYIINKGRKEKKMLTEYPKTDFRQLTTTIERYSNTFAKAGFPVHVKFETIFPTKEELPSLVSDITGQRNGKWIGIAPFAQHQGKIYPPEKMEQVVSYFSHKEGHKVLLFGGGAYEKSKLEEWEKRYPNTISLAGKIKLGQELLVMDNLDVMVSMDSANMHLASICATPVVSIWGATHPYAGFYGWNQPYENIIQHEMDCRPCSVYGNKECMWGDYRCMNIDPMLIVDKIESIVK